MRRGSVAITGLGSVSPVGIGVEAAWESIVAGRSGVGEITTFDTSAYPVHIAGLVDDFDPTVVLDAKEVRRLSLFQQFALVAAAEAMEDSGLGRLAEADAERAGGRVG